MPTSPQRFWGDGDHRLLSGSRTQQLAGDPYRLKWSDPARHTLLSERDTGLVGSRQKGAERSGAVLRFVCRKRGPASLPGSRQWLPVVRHAQFCRPRGSRSHRRRDARNYARASCRAVGADCSLSDAGESRATAASMDGAAPSLCAQSHPSRGARWRRLPNCQADAAVSCWRRRRC